MSHWLQIESEFLRTPDLCSGLSERGRSGYDSPVPRNSSSGPSAERGRSVYLHTGNLSKNLFISASIHLNSNSFPITF